MAKTRVYNIYLLHVIEVMNMKQLGVREYTEKDIVSVVRKCLIIIRQGLKGKREVKVTCMKAVF